MKLFLILNFVILLPVNAGPTDYEIRKLCYKSSNYIQCKNHFGLGDQLENHLKNNVKVRYTKPIPIKVKPYKIRNY